MKLIRLFIILFLIFCQTSIFAQVCTFSGVSQTFALDTIKIYKQNDCISKQKVFLTQFVVKENGEFSFSINTKDPLEIYLDLEVFWGIVYVEKGENFDLVLPKKQELLPEDKYNPFFDKQSYYLMCMNAKDNSLNTLIPKFDKYYTYAQNIIISSPYKYNKPKTDSLEQKILKEFQEVNNSFFDTYRDCKLALLDILAYNRSSKDVFEKLIFGKPICTFNKAYIELFDEIFKDIFLPSNSFGLKTLAKNAARSDMNQLRKIITSDNRFKNTDLTNLIILKGMHDAFYGGMFNQQSIIELNSKYKEFVNDNSMITISNHLNEEFTNLQVSYPIPSFYLPDFDGKFMHENDVVSSKFTYLCFMNPALYTCKVDIDLLVGLSQKYKNEVLNIVVVLVGDKNDCTLFYNNYKQNNITFVWYDNDNQLLMDYDLRVFPSYFLVDPLGNLSLKQCQGPKEEFEFVFENLYRNYKIKEQRNNYNKSNF